jgi:peptidoglycan/xylan/chitin deacetylase (PgdA/CDA1 family)
VKRFFYAIDQFKPAKFHSGGKYNRREGFNDHRQHITVLGFSEKLRGLVVYFCVAILATIPIVSGGAAAFVYGAENSPMERAPAFYGNAWLGDESKGLWRQGDTWWIDSDTFLDIKRENQNTALMSMSGGSVTELEVGGRRYFRRIEGSLEDIDGILPDINFKTAYGKTLFEARKVFLLERLQNKTFFDVRYLSIQQRQSQNRSFKLMSSREMNRQASNFAARLTPPKPGEHIIYLTFDDGPNKETVRILALLKKYNQKATFFVLKGSMDANPKVVQSLYNSGQGIGLHGISHSKEIFYKTPDTALWEMEESNKTLESLIGARTIWIRTPYGSYPRLTRAHFDRLTASGYHVWDWNVDSGDSSAKDVLASVIFERTVTGIEKLKGKTTIVLMHDRPSTVSALESILIYMKRTGIVSKVLPMEGSVHQTIVP